MLMSKWTLLYTEKYSTPFIFAPFSPSLSADESRSSQMRNNSYITGLIRQSIRFYKDIFNMCLGEFKTGPNHVQVNKDKKKDGAKITLYTVCSNGDKICTILKYVFAVLHVTQGAYFSVMIIRVFCSYLQSEVICLFELFVIFLVILYYIHVYIKKYV